MKRLFVLVLGALPAFAGVPDQCVIGVTDLKTGNYAALPFEAEIGEEELTTKTWALKEIDRVVTARVYYTDEWVAIRWPDEKSINDISVTVRLDVEKKAKRGHFSAVGPGTQTNVILTDFNNLKAMDVCKKALSDNDYAASIAPGGNLPVLLTSCERYVDNKGKNSVGVARETKGQRVTLTCKE